MATNISIDVYEFSTGMSFDRKYTQGIVVADITGMVPASIYDFKNTYFNGVRSKILVKNSGVPLGYYVAQTVAQIKTLLDA